MAKTRPGAANEHDVLFRLGAVVHPQTKAEIDKFKRDDEGGGPRVRRLRSANGRSEGEGG